MLPHARAPLLFVELWVDCFDEQLHVAPLEPEPLPELPLLEVELELPPCKPLDPLLPELLPLELPLEELPLEELPVTLPPPELWAPPLEVDPLLGRVPAPLPLLPLETLPEPDEPWLVPAASPLGAATGSSQAPVSGLQTETPGQSELLWQ